MPRMTASDASWYRMDRRRNETDIVALLLFDAPLDVARVRAIVEERLLPVERFRARAVPSWAGAPRWEPDPDFELDRHLVTERVEAGTLEDYVGDVTTARLDPARPLWRLHLVEHAGGGALVAKFHHSIGDGFALVALLLALADGPAPSPAPRPPPHRARSLALPSLPSPRQAAGYALALARLALLGSDPAEVSAADLTGVRRVAWTAALPLDAIHEAARRRGGTTNDLVVCAVAGGLRAHLEATGADAARRHRAFVPVNLRARRPDVVAGEPLGNEFGLVYVDLPLELDDRAARFEAVRRSILALRASPDPVLTQQVLAACGLLPDPLHHALTTFFARKASAVLTNVPGPRARLRFAGQEVASVLFWVPHPASLGLGISILSYAGEVRVGVRADVAVVPRPARLVARIEDEVRALLEV